MAPVAAPHPTAPGTLASPEASATTMVVEQRPLGEFARGSYVWPAWAVVAIALATVGVVAAAQVMTRRAGKARR